MAFEFRLAEQMGRTVAELRRSLSNAEFVQWRAFYRLRDQQEKEVNANV